MEFNVVRCKVIMKFHRVRYPSSQTELSIATSVWNIPELNNKLIIVRANSAFHFEMVFIRLARIGPNWSVSEIQTKPLVWAVTELSDHNKQHFFYSILFLFLLGLLFSQKGLS